jgi:aspartate kinase
MSSINVFKFGGASVKDATAVRNVAAILKMYPGEKLIVVVSAMGKTTNALERLHQARFHKQATPEILIEIEDYHREICEELFGNEHDSLLDPVFRDLRKSVGMPCSESYDFEYDQIVCHGELISTLIIQEFLVRQGLPSVRIDVREIIYTDNRYRDARLV